MCTTARAAVPQCRCVSRGPASSWIDHAMRQHHKLQALRIGGRAMASPNPMPPVVKSTLTGSSRDGRSRLTVAVKVWTVSAESVIPQTGGRRFLRANHGHGSLHRFDNSAIGLRQASARYSARWPAMASQRPLGRCSTTTARQIAPRAEVRTRSFGNTYTPKSLGPGKSQIGGQRSRQRSSGRAPRERSPNDDY
jgi:hypothetical protein